MVLVLSECWMQIAASFFWHLCVIGRSGKPPRCQVCLQDDKKFTRLKWRLKKEERYEKVKKSVKSLMM